VIEYKGFVFVRPPKWADLEPLFRAIDWGEAHSIVKPGKTCEILFKPYSAYTRGRYDPTRNRIYLYESKNQHMPSVLVHELTHLWQWKHWRGTVADWNREDLESDAEYYENLYLTYLMNQ
jgi:hypothetical protein